MTRHPGAILLLALAVTACHQKVYETRPTIQYVRDILADKSCHEITVLESCAEINRGSDISVIGPQNVCEALAERLLEYDVRDNVDGSSIVDGLPDFAGETFSCIADTVSYQSMLDSSTGQEALRTRMVSRVLAALDTVSHISPYDMEGLSYKPSSKIVVVADPYLSQYGLFDADTLFRSTGCKVKLVSSLDLMVDKVLDRVKDRPLTVGVIYDGTVASPDIYEARLAAKASERGIPAAKCVAIAAADSAGIIHQLLDKCLTQDNLPPLDAIIVDDFSLDTEALKAELAGLVSVMNESSMTYAKYVGKGCSIYNALDETASACYYILRKDNLFTHKVEKPQVEFFVPAPRPDTDDGSIILIPGSYVQN